MTDDPYRTLGFVLHDVARLLRKRFEQKVRGLGLTRSQWQVLAHLARHDGIQQGGLAEILEIEPITLGRLVDRLAAVGLVERRHDPRDRRVWRLHILPPAHPILERMRALGAETREEALVGLSPVEREHLIETLLAVRANLSDGAAARQSAERAATNATAEPSPPATPRRVGHG